MKRIIDGAAIALVSLAVLMSSSCAVIAVADAAVTVASTVVKTGVKVTGAVVGAVIP